MSRQRPYAPATPFERPEGALKPATPLRPCPIYRGREEGRGLYESVTFGTPLRK